VKLDGLRWQHDKALAFEFEITDDFRPEEAVDVAGGGDFKAGPEFLGDDASADPFAAFEHEDFSPGAGEIRGSDETVMARADNDGVVLGIIP